MNKLFLLSIGFLIIFGGLSFAEEPVDIIGGPGDYASEADQDELVLGASWICSDPFGEFDESLGAAGSLNRALGLVFSGHASQAQLSMETDEAENYPGDISMSPFAVDVLDRLKEDFPEAFPEQVELAGFDLSPGDVTQISEDDPHLFAVHYEGEEYLERLLQRLYFKLIQGPVLLTVPYCGSDPSVPEEYRDWNNFRYYSNGSTMVWDESRLVYVDWDLTQTVVLTYEDGLIACYDSGRKYYIDHTAAIAAAGAMMAHPDLAGTDPQPVLNYVLTTEDEQ
jgi:hypothetical protein